MTITNKQIENSKMAYAIMFGIPHERIDLYEVRNTDEGKMSDEKFLAPNCNTTGCVAGFLSAHPFFKEQGLKWKKKDAMIQFKTKDVQTDDLNEMSDILFGDYNTFDGGPRGIEGKIVALSRIRKHLHESGVISDKRNDQLSVMEDEVYEAGLVADELFLKE